MALKTILQVSGWHLCYEVQNALEWFAAECEATGMRVSTSQSEAMVHCWNTVDPTGGADVVAPIEGVQVFQGLDE